VAARGGPTLKKELGLFDAYAIATGATLSSGFFLLPGLAAASAGPAVPIAYLVAALFLLPGILSKTELATALPRAGGEYYFLDRSTGPLMGTIAGFGTWLALILKTAFALDGIGAYLSLFMPDTPMAPIAAGFAILFGMVNWWGAKKSGAAQGVLVIGLLVLLAWFIGFGLPDVQARHFQNLFGAGHGAIISTAGLVVVSYMGLTKVASVAEEVHDPERNLPLGMFLALATALAVYVLGTVVMVGVLPSERLAGDLTPVASTADHLFGHWGAVIMTVAAVLAFSSVANAGIMSASRYPLAMSRDHLLPPFFRKISRQGSPGPGIAVTVLLVLVFVTVFDPTHIAKLASSFLLLMFALNALAVIVLRESHIASYDPGFRSPLYPWLHVVGVLAPVWLIFQLGFLSIAFTITITVAGSLWYRYYARDRVVRAGAIYHLFERLGRSRHEALDSEFRTILKEKGLRDDDPFDEIVARAGVLDFNAPTEFEDAVVAAARLLAERAPETAEAIATRIMDGTRVGATPVTHGVALPHLRVKGLAQNELVLVRSRPGVRLSLENPLAAGSSTQEITVHTLFFLASPEDDPAQHLRILAQIAGRVDEESFASAWEDARDEQELKEVLLRDERFFSFTIAEDSPSSALVGTEVQQMDLPAESLIAMIRRGDEMLIPRGNTRFELGDRITIIGQPEAISYLAGRYPEVPGKRTDTPGGW